MISMSLEHAVTAMRGRLLGSDHDLAITGVCTDSRQVEPGRLFFALRGPTHDGHSFVGSALLSGAMAAVVSDCEALPALVKRASILIVVDDTTAALGRLAAYHRQQLPGTLVAITGSNGKTTTKNMIHAVLSRTMRGHASPKSFNNAIGVPLTLLSANRDDGYVVAEIGTNAPGEVAELAGMVQPHVAVITSVGPSHLAGLGDLAGVAAEKASLADGLGPDGLAVVNVDCPELARRFSDRRSHDIVRYGLGEAAALRATDVVTMADGVSFRIDGATPVRLAILGRHNVYNALAAVAVGRWFGLSDAHIAEGLSTVEPALMRLAPMAVGPITVINDGYNANPDSMAAALAVLADAKTEGRRVAVLGDMLELGEASGALHEALGRQAGQCGIEVLVAVGQFADTICRAARGGGTKMAVFGFENTDEVAARIGGLLQPGDVVLIKGSLLMRMEALIPAIREAFGEKTASDSSAPR